MLPGIIAFAGALALGTILAWAVLRSGWKMALRCAGIVIVSTLAVGLASFLSSPLRAPTYAVSALQGLVEELTRCLLLAAAIRHEEARTLAAIALLAVLYTIVGALLQYGAIYWGIAQFYISGQTLAPWATVEIWATARLTAVVAIRFLMQFGLVFLGVRSVLARKWGVFALICGTHAGLGLIIELFDL